LACSRSPARCPLSGTRLVDENVRPLTPDDRELRVGRTLAVTPPRQTPETAPSPAVGITSQP